MTIPQDGESHVFGTGIEFEWTAPPSTLKRLEEKEAWHRKSETHMWISIAMYILSDESMKNIATEQVHLDMENLFQVHMGCYLCEEAFTPKMLKRRCKGQPPGELKYV